MRAGERRARVARRARVRARRAGDRRDRRGRRVARARDVTDDRAADNLDQMLRGRPEPPRTKHEMFTEMIHFPSGGERRQLIWLGRLGYHFWFFIENQFKRWWVCFPYRAHLLF